MIRGFLHRRILCAFVLISLTIGAYCLLPPVGSYREIARHSQCGFNLKMIGLALHSYHDEWGTFPPASIEDKNGRPIHSWRTLILPYLDQAPLYNAYRFDEPWDGPHNAKLHEKSTSAAVQFQCPADSDRAVGQTSYLAVVGPNTAWPGAVPAKLDKDFQDGGTSPILVIEVVNSGIHWLEPRDLYFDEMNFAINNPGGDAMSSRHTEKGNWPWSDRVAYVHVLLADGSVKKLSQDTAADVIRRMMTVRRTDGGVEPR